MKLKIHICILTLTSLFLFSFKTASYMKLSQTPLLDSTAFNFWLGTWNATWDENGTTCHGTSEITRIMNNTFIHESFSILDGANKGFKGESFSTLDNTDGKWKQTWIDTDGSYLDFTGGIDGDTKLFERNIVNTKGIKTYQRMRFYNIKPDSFLWDWEKSEDGIKWNLSWRISYTRDK